jgi:hypothetical protein
VFHVLKWTPKELDRTIESLIQEGVVQEIQVEGVGHVHLLSTHAYDGIVP